MAELKQLFETLGYSRVRTYIQSGNVLFESDGESKQIRERIEHEIKVVFGYSVTVILRTDLELERIIRNCPFAPDTLSEGESLNVCLLVESPLQEGIDRLNDFRSDMDEYQIDDQEVYLLFRQGLRNSKLANNLQKLGVPGTVRNWKTMNRLVSMAEEMRV